LGHECDFRDCNYRVTDFVFSSSTSVPFANVYIYAIVQHFRIIKTKSSEGLSPLFLLLGSTSATAGMWNMYAL